MACLAIVSSVSAALAFSAARGMPAFEPALRRWGAAMLCIVATAAGLLIRPVLPPALTVALPHLLTFGAVALLASAADALQGKRSGAASAVWWVAGASSAALVGAQASSAPHAVVMAIGSGGLALAFGLQGWMLSAHLRRALHSVPAWVLCLSSLSVAAAFALRVAVIGVDPQGASGVPAWLSGHPLLVVGVTFVSIGSQAFFSMLHERQRAALRDVYQRDSLTGLYIRGEFFRRAQAMLQEARPGDAFAVVMVDLDHFKRINDTYGHIVGDRVIAHAARLLQASTRLHDVAGRYGGEEFCLLLRECDADRARTFARRLLRMAEQPVSLRDGRSIAVTLSVGYLAFRVDGGAPSLELLVDRADQALLRAKAQGRNRAVDAQGMDDRDQDVPRVA